MRGKKRFSDHGFKRRNCKFVVPKTNKRRHAMSMRLLYWILILLWVLFIGWHSYNTGWNFYVGGGSLLQFILFVLLGWKVFGPPIEG